jgi:hypothetical protein
MTKMSDATAEAICTSNALRGVVGLKRKKMTMASWRHARETYVGWCRGCGAERSCTEPDARHYGCERCGEPKVFGADEWVSEDWVEIFDDEVPPCSS